MKRDGYLCMHAAFCVGRLKRIPELMEGVDDSDVRARDHRDDGALPVGLVHVRAHARTARTSSPTIPSASPSPQEEGELAGPLWVTGGIPLLRSDGQPFETRNRMTLCRCGHSQMKPLCDGTHREIDFRERVERPPQRAASCQRSTAV